MSDREVFLISFDPGFGNAKGAWVEPGVGTRVAVVPSVVGVGETDLGLLSVGKMGRRRRQAIPDRVAFGGVSYLVGENVARFARPVQRMDFLRLSDGPELRALFYAALYRLLGAGVHRADLMVGLPVEVLADRARGRATLRGLRAWMVGAHEFAVNDEEAVLEVEGVQAMAQPAGAFFAWGLNDRGEWTKGKDNLKAPVAVCDVGFNTLDLFAVEGGKVVGRFTGGDTAGMRRAAELLVAAVRERYGIELSLHEADALMRQRQPRLYTSQGEVNVRALASQAQDTAAAGVVTFVEQRWGNGKRFAHLLFSGGGAAALEKGLLQQYPHGVVLPDPVSANAVGLARYVAWAARG
jgi:hypothetical protein